MTRSAHNSGFSLLEVLVASAVLAIVLTILLAALTTSLSLWRNTEKKLFSDREARAAELLIAQDLATAVVPSEPNLWPRVFNGRLQFLTAKPEKLQNGDKGDVCFVEYWVDKNSGALNRSIYYSSETFKNVLLPGSFPSSSKEPDLLATNILSDAKNAVKGLAIEREVNNENFVVLGTNNPSGQLLPLRGAYSQDNPPIAIEVNFAVTDPESWSNQDLWKNPSYKLNHAGLYSFRVDLPAPPK
jgi:prepilin-type N-terminal cleavage/methylation domain-containing protein